jgi:hypothetical protein
MSSPGPVTLVLDDGHGCQETAVLPGPGGDIRFAVGEQGRHAAVWKIWARPKKCDVYVAIRHLGGYQKVSLHQSSQGSDWRFQWTSEHMQATPELTDRVIDRWQRPPQVGETGWTKSFSIWTRHQDVVPMPDDQRLPADLLWLPPPPEGYAMGIHVVIARPMNLFVEMKGSIPVAGFALADGQVVLLVASRHLVTDEQNRMIEDALAKVIELAPGGADQVRILLQAADLLRMLLWGNGPDGERKAWDVAVEPSASAGVCSLRPWRR